MASKEQKMIRIYELMSKTTDLLVLKFLDPDSDKMLDEKIEVLESLKDGKSPADIPKYYDVLEDYPTDTPQHKTMWD